MRKKFTILTAVLLLLAMIHLPGNAVGQTRTTTYKLTQVTSVSAGNKYVFVNDGYAITTVSNSKLQSVNNYSSTGLHANESYVWELETATNGFYMKNASLSSNQYLNNSSSTNVSMGSKNSIWSIAFTNGIALISNKSNENRFLGDEGQSNPKHLYKAYANTINNLSNYPHDFTVYLLEEETSSTFTVTYNANGATSGNVPTDATQYNSTNNTVTVKGNIGDPVLAKYGHTWGGWCLDEEGTGTVYGPSYTPTYTISSNTTFYAKWIPNTHNVTSVPGSDQYGSYAASATTNVPYGTIVTLTYTPATGYENYEAVWSVNGTMLMGNTFPMPDEDVEVSVAVFDWDKDVLNADFTGNPSSYTDWSNKTGATGAIYAGNSSGSTNYIQIRAQSPSGIVTTFSESKVKRVIVTWNSGTAEGRQLDIYGKNTAYTSSANLYSDNSGTFLGSIVKGTSNSLTITGDYQFIGLRSNANAMYLDEIKICWEPLPKYDITVNNQITGGSIEADLTNAIEGATVSLTATPSTHYEFTSWSVCKTGDPNTIVTVTDNQFSMPAYGVTVSAVFTILPQYNINIPVSIEDNVVVDATNNKAYEGDEVTIFVMAPDEQFLTSLVVTGDVTNNTVTLLPEVSTTEDTYTFNMPAENVTIAATFASNYIIQFSVNGTIDNDLEATVAIGGSTMLPTSVTPPAGFAFAGWTTNESNTATILTGNYSPSADMTMYAVFSITVTGEEEEHVVILDGAGFGTSEPSSETTLTTGGFTYKYTGAYRSAVPGGASNCFTSDYVILIKGSGNYIYNTTGFGNGITKFEVYANKGASTSAAVGINFSTDAISAYNANANNTWTQTLNPADHIYDASSALPTGAKYFWLQTTGSKNAQIQLRITYTTTGSTTTYYTRVFTKDIAKDTWHFIASPVGTAPVNMSDLTDLYFYDEAAHYWRNKEVSANADGFDFALGKGYLAAYHVEENPENQITLTFAGTSVCTDDSKAVDVTYNGTIGEETNPLAGWNLVGNPYPHAAYLSQSFYMTAYDTENSKWVVQASTAGTVATCAGAMVKVDSGVTSVLFSKNAPSAPNNGSVKISLGQQVMERGSVSSTLVDNAIVSFNEGSELPKFYFGNPNANLYIPQGEKEFAILSAEAQGEMPLNFRANADGQYTLTVNPEGVEMNYLHLVDNMTGNDVDLLATPSYTFNATTRDYESRFRLVFAANNENGVSAGSTTFAFYSNGNWMVNNEGEATLQVIDVMGRVLSNQTISGTAELSLNQQPGVYVLRLVNGNDVKTQKIVVR